MKEGDPCFVHLKEKKSLDTTFPWNKNTLERNRVSICTPRNHFYDFIDQLFSVKGFLSQRIHHLPEPPGRGHPSTNNPRVFILGPNPYKCSVTTELLLTEN